MLAILSIDTLSQRYGILPSKLLETGSTFDLWICNSAIRYQQSKQAETQGDFSHIDQEELEKIRNSIE